MILNERDIVLRFQALESAVRQLQPLALEALEQRVAELESARVVALADKPTEPGVADDVTDLGARVTALEALVAAPQAMINPVDPQTVTAAGVSTDDANTGSEAAA